jgi:hypothetical protein
VNAIQSLHVLVVRQKPKRREIAPKEKMSRDTPGELLRQNQLIPDPDAVSDFDDERQLGLFLFEIDSK